MPMPREDTLYDLVLNDDVADRVEAGDELVPVLRQVTALCLANVAQAANKVGTTLALVFSRAAVRVGPAGLFTLQEERRDA